MRTRIILIGAAALVVLVGAAAWSVLPACGLRPPFGLGEWQLCPSAAAKPRQADDSRLERAALLGQINEAEARLSALECRPAKVPTPEPQLDRQTIEGGDVTGLEGCWALGAGRWDQITTRLTLTPGQASNTPAGRFVLMPPARGMRRCADQMAPVAKARFR